VTNFYRLWLFICFSGQPLNDKCRVVVGKKVVVEALLDEECCDEVFESDQGVVFLFRNIDLDNFTESAENLSNVTQFIPKLTFSRSSLTN